MTDLVNLTRTDSARVAVNNATATAWANPFSYPTDATDNVVVRIATDVNVHVRRVNNDVDEADEDDYLLFAGFDISVTLGRAQHLSFLAYTESLGTKENGDILFVARANTSDVVSIDDGVNPAKTFTFGDGTGGSVDKGTTAVASAANLAAAIQASIDATDLDVSVMRFGTRLLIVNNNYVDGAIGESGTGVSSRITVTDFTGGAAPDSPPSHSGSVWVNRV